jgi:hypothetical protein
VSEFSKSRICEIFGVKEKRVKVVGNGVEPLFFDVAEEDPEEVSPLKGQSYSSPQAPCRRRKVHLI